MSKIIVRRQEYANNGTHANEIEAVVQQNLIANTLSSATDIAASVGLVKSETDAIKESLSTWESITEYTDQSLITNIYQGLTLGVFTAVKSGNVVNGVVTFYPSGTITLPNNTTIAKMPTYLAPAKSLNVVAYNGGGRHMLIYLNHNGDIATSWGDTVTTALSIPFTVITSE